MKFCRKVSVLAAVFVCGLLMLTSVSAGELEKWIPGDAILYGKVSGKVIRESALFKQLLQKYPVIQQYIQSGREHIGNYQGDLDTLVFTVSPEVPSAAFFLEFAQPFRPDAVAAGLAAKGMEGKYEKCTIAGKSGYVLTQETLQGRGCFLMLSDRVMLACMENAAQALLGSQKISGALVKKMQAPAEADVFLQVFPGASGMLQDGGVRDFELVGRLTAEASLKLAARLTFADEIFAQNAEMQIRQGMMLLLGIAFVDDGELGMDFIRRIKVKRTKNNVFVKATLSADLIARLVTYGEAQVKKREAQKAEQPRRAVPAQENSAAQ